jgi:hypothetical protein
MTGGEALQGVEVTFIFEWYDGPLTGVARHQGVEYYFEAEGHLDDTFELSLNDRRLFLYPITADELAVEGEWQRLFDEHVRDQPESEKWKFYEPYAKREQPDYASRTPVGWFTAE